MASNNPDKIYLGNQSFPVNPGVMDYVKEAFLPMDQRALIEHNRQIMQTKQAQDAQAGAAQSSPWTNMPAPQGGQ